MADAAEAGAVTKSGAKNAKSEAQKYYKRKNDPTGLAKIEEGDVFMKAGDFAKAKECYDVAYDICKNSTVERAAKPKGEAPPKVSKEANAPAVQAESSAKLLLSNPKENIQAKPMRDGVAESENYAKNTPEQLAAHLKATGGKYITRFPPEPNGYLHIGHAKAMNFNFGQARIAAKQNLGGETIMRFDDTNPEAEKQEYIDSILKNVEWLGNKPVKVTYSSDYFEELYQLALQLIKQGDAYVCHQTKAEIKASRDALRAARATPGLTEPPAAGLSPWRNASVEENLAKFEKMRTGQYDEGEASLRMKGDLMSDNPAMWDTGFYRTKFTPHPHSGDKWCIYPTYDYTHCIVDSLENITHSLCTLEFETRQAVDGPYYWLLNKLGIYKPVTWEYSRCNITHNVLSKRKLHALVVRKQVSGWDDPRLLTLDGLRRRGYTASSINAFCEHIGVTRSGNINIQMALLENCIRMELDTAAPRRFCVVKPIRVDITGMAGEVACTVANHPKDEAMGTRPLVLGNAIYIERDDFRENDDASFYGLAPGKDVGLLGTSMLINCTEVKKDADGNVVSIVCSAKERGDAKVKGNLHWVLVKTAVPCECRIYSNLFTVENPQAAQDAPKAGEAAPAAAGEEEDDDEAESGGFMDYFNKNSLLVEKGSVCEPSLKSEAANYGAAFQFQRVGFFCVDLDSKPNGLVFNRTVALKQ